MEFDLFHLSFLLEVEYVSICFCVFFCCKLSSFISVGSLFVIALLSFKQKKFLVYIHLKTVRYKVTTVALNFFNLDSFVENFSS